jgi:hypothetical protein
MSQTFTVGDLVIPDLTMYPASAVRGVYKIEKAPRTAREKNYTARPVNGGRGVKIVAELLTPFTGTEEEARTYQPAATVTFEPYVATPDHGTVVKISGVAKVDPEHLYVVLGDARKPGAVKVTRLGGVDGGRYFPAIPVKMLTVVPLDRITVAPE